MNNQYKIRKIKCLGCGKVVTKRMPAGRKYCSLACWRKSKGAQNKTGKATKCEWCGKVFYKPKSRLQKHNFCSVQCANLWQSRNKRVFICKICGKTFKLNLAMETHEGKNPSFCSIKCMKKEPDYNFFKA